MEFWQKILNFLQAKMTTPTAFGWFHLLCIGIMLFAIYFLYKRKEKHSERQLKSILLFYGLVVFILEVLKQISWSVNYDAFLSEFVWDYRWYAFPFQLCTTPMFVSLICIFLKKGKLRSFLLSYMAYTTILGSVAIIIMPNNCLVSDILANVHTMWLHMGSFVVSVYLLISGEVKINIKEWAKSIPVFLGFMTIANILNIMVYNANVLQNDSFNMFYISPYYVSSLPLFDVIQKNTPYVVFLAIYILALVLGSYLVYLIANFSKKINQKFKQRNLPSK